jgi:DNA-directed RNA polymerase beta' subunit
MNADFDGDELNVHSIQSFEGYKELEQCLASKTLISCSDGNPYKMIVQDAAIALYLMSIKNEKINCNIFIDDLERINVNRSIIYQKSINDCDTFALLSSFFPRKLLIYTPEIKIINGIWISGICNKNTINFIIMAVVQNFGNEIASKMISKIQKVSVLWLYLRGYTVNYDDFKHVNDIDSITKDLCEKNYNNIRDIIHKKYLENNSFSQNLKHYIESGTKGSSLNIGQIKITIGQQEHQNGIILPSLSLNRVITSDNLLTNNKFDKLIHEGYITESFASGLSIRSFFIHNIPSRQQVVAVSVSTATTGYGLHKLVKLVEDFTVEDGRLVNNASKTKTISLIYNNGLNPFNFNKKIKCVVKSIFEIK